MEKGEGRREGRRGESHYKIEKRTQMSLKRRVKWSVKEIGSKTLSNIINLLLHNNNKSNLSNLLLVEFIYVFLFWY